MSGPGSNHSDEVRIEDIDISVVMACYTEERLANIDAALFPFNGRSFNPAR